MGNSAVLYCPPSAAAYEFLEVMDKVARPNTNTIKQIWKRRNGRLERFRPQSLTLAEGRPLPFVRIAARSPGDCTHQNFSTRGSLIVSLLLTSNPLDTGKPANELRRDSLQPSTPPGNAIPVVRLAIAAQHGRRLGARLTTAGKATSRQKGILLSYWEMMFVRACRLYRMTLTIALSKPKGRCAGV